jgi:hypothetical protein
VAEYLDEVVAPVYQDVDEEGCSKKEGDQMLVLERASAMKCFVPIERQVLEH